MLTVISFILFTAAASALTIWITRKDERNSSDGFFLGGRSLTFPIIAGSLLLTNLSTEQMVGLNGAAFKDGLSVMAWEVNAVIALIIMALFFLPRFLRTGITTVPQFLEQRYDTTTQSIANTIFLLAYALILIPLILYSGARGLIDMMDLSSLTGIESDTTLLRLTTIIIGIGGLLYARFGGLRTLAVLDTINGIGLLIGGFTIAWLSIDAVGGNNGIAEGWKTLNEVHPERLDSTGDKDFGLPFGTLFTGVALLNLFYWCTNQQIIQRTFGASSLAEGQKGVLLTGGIKLLGPLYLVIPGIVAYHLYASDGISNDQAYGTLVRNLLPDHLTGFFAAVMVGAILSSFNAALNSTSALFSLGLYKHSINPEGTEEQTVKAAKLFVVFIAIAAMIGAPFLAANDSIFAYLQDMNSIYFIPIFSVVAVGMLNRNVPGKAASIAMIAGVGLLCIGLFGLIEEGEILGMHKFHFMGVVFAALVIFLLVMSKISPRSEPWTIATNTSIDMTPWTGAKWAALVLAIIVITIYVTFSK